jgi:hypothetical protein
MKETSTKQGQCIAKKEFRGTNSIYPSDRFDWPWPDGAIGGTPDKRSRGPVWFITYFLLS